ncbi:MAG: HipA N-terminal domain-containing protein [Oscillospiraceae bacterium]|nr:HipA N-terminal domain-containing protein [Oscillospiraceae bacterium]MDD4368075.1 HipA N-terminal domain-containing protein [Oscillospiraceae bacterium]
MTVLRSASVYVRDRYAGRLNETDEGYVFTYSQAYLAEAEATAVSLTLPLQSAAFTSKYLFPFFDGLLPEGWLLDIVSRNWKLSPADRFGLLLCACRDCIGNVSIQEAQP